MTTAKEKPMKRMALFLTAIVCALFLMGSGPCDPPGLADSIDPIGTYQDALLQNGDQGVAPQQPLVVDIGKLMLYSTVNAGTVTLALQAGGGVTGDVNVFDSRDCAVDPVNDCPRGLYFEPGSGVPCDLDPNTTYVLTISGVVLANGDTLPDRIITFTTGGFPDGYTPDLCSAVVYENFIVSGDTLNDTTGMTGATVLDPSSQLEIAAVGIEKDSLSGYDRFANPRYYAVIKILNSEVGAFGGADFVIADGDTLRIRYNGQDKVVVLPGATIPSSDFISLWALFLYVADDGSTYYAINDGGGRLYDTLSFICDDFGGGCPSAKPPTEVFTGSTLALGDGGTVPFKFSYDEIDPTDSPPALNGGIITTATSGSRDIEFSLLGIEDGTITGGWDELNNSINWRVFFHNAVDGTYSYPDPTKVDFSQYLIGHINRALYDDFYHPVKHLYTNDGLLMIYLENRDSAPYTPPGTPTITVTDGDSTTVSLPTDTIPAGEALPLYVASDGSSFYAYINGGDHTLDLWANGCDIGLCPTLDPVTALTNAPAAVAP
jgi:hypothetical protein